MAITRAEKLCLLSYAKSRFRYGKVEYGMPSRFLKDIDRGYIEQSSQGGQTALFGADRSATPWGRSSSQSGMWGASDAPRFMSSRTQSASRTQTIQPTQRRTIISAKPAASPSWEQTKPEVPISMKPVAPSSRRLVSPNASGGATRVAQLTPGQLIGHERFGVGEVIKVEGTGENTKALIRFKNAGEKQLLLKFARFRVLG